MHQPLLMLKVVFVVLLVLLLYSAFAGKQFWKSVFSDGGKGSLSRVMTAMNGIFAMAWVTYIVFHNKVLPSTDMLTLAAFVNAPYGIGVAGAVGKAAANGKNGKNGAHEPKPVEAKP